MSADQVAPMELVDGMAPERTSILAVDDDESQLEVLEYRLTRLGFRVRCAQCGKQALQLAFDEPPDLVLLDLRLPDMHGFDVCSRLADAPQTCGIPIIIVSAVESHDIVRHARSVGGRYFVRKPYDPNVLWALIEKTLGQSVSDWE